MINLTIYKKYVCVNFQKKKVQIPTKLSISWLFYCDLGEVSLYSLSSSLRCIPPFQANFFDEYQMEGVTSEDNEICLEVSPENLSRALKTIQNAKAVKVKLTKKHCPCLTVAAELVRH